MNGSKASGVFDEAKGKLKQAFGEAINNDSVANEGAADQVKGSAEQTWGNVKDAAHNVTTGSGAHTTESHAEATGHNLRDDITSGAGHLKDSIKHGLENIEHKTKN